MPRTQMHERLRDRIQTDPLYMQCFPLVVNLSAVFGNSAPVPYACLNVSLQPGTQLTHVRARDANLCGFPVFGWALRQLQHATRTTCATTMFAEQKSSASAFSTRTRKRTALKAAVTARNAGARAELERARAQGRLSLIIQEGVCCSMELHVFCVALAHACDNVFADRSYKKC